MNKQELAAYKEQVAINRLISDFMTASTPIETYLQQDAIDGHAMGPY
jgi:hypothetical protein